MNAHLMYWSGQSYSQHFATFKVKVTRSQNGKRVHCSFSETATDSKSFASFSLPFDKSAQLAQAILTACAGGLSQPIEFVVDEVAAQKSTVAA